MEAFIGSIMAGTLVLTGKITNVWIRVEQPDLTDYIYEPGNIAVSDCGHQLWTYTVSILEFLWIFVSPYLVDGFSGAVGTQIYS